MDLDLNSLLEAVGIQNERQADIAGKITGNYEEMSRLGDQRAVAISSAGDSDAIIAQQKAAGEYAAQQNARKFATAVGTNMDDNSELMTSLGMAYREKAAAAIAANHVVTQKMAVKPFDDPLQYIVNQITVGDDINYANQLQEEADQVSGTMAKMNQDTQQTAVTQNTIAATKSAASVQASANTVLQKAAEQALQVQQQNLQFNVHSLETVSKLGQDQLANMFSANNAITAQKHLAIAQAQLEESRKMHELAMAERLDKLEAKRADLAEQEAMAETVRKGLTTMGYDGATIPTTKVMQYLKLKDPTYLDALKSGMTVESTGMGILGTNPGEAAISVARTKAPLAPGMKPVRDFLMNTAQAVQDSGKDSKGMVFDPKDTGKLQGAISGAVLDRAKAQAANIDVNNPNNIYAPVDINSISRVAPGVMETELYKKILQPQVATGLVDVNPNRLVALTTSAINQGQISFNDASKGLATLYAGAIATNNATRDYVRVGIPPQQSFNTAVTVKNANTPDALSFATEAKVQTNMSDISSVNNLLSRSLASSVKRSINWSGAGASFNSATQTLKYPPLITETKN